MQEHITGRTCRNEEIPFHIRLQIALNARRVPVEIKRSLGIDLNLSVICCHDEYGVRGITVYNLIKNLIHRGQKRINCLLELPGMWAIQVTNSVYPVEVQKVIGRRGFLRYYQFPKLCERPGKCLIWYSRGSSINNI